jgi:outer membrane receptor protein involved in Fe transport
VVAAIRAANPNTITPATVICHNDTGTLYFGAYGSIVGRKLPRVPEHNVNMGIDYSRPLSDDWNVSMGANVSYTSKRYVQVDNLAYTGEATLLSASLGLSNERYAVTLWGKNLTDEDSVVSASRFTDATNQSLRAFFGMNRLPRQIGLSAAVKF